MLSTSQMLEIISGRKKGVLATLMRTGLSFLTPIYRAVVEVRNRRFDSGRAEVHQVDVPVISIGNLTTGGTGKTPMVVWVARRLRRSSMRPAIVSRGYGAENTSQGRNDEALELEHRLPDVPHLQDPDRVRIAQIAIEELESQVILLDDGFQHRRLARDLDVVLIDATEPFGFGRLLPRGLLREPIASLSRAHAVVLTRCDAIDGDSKREIRELVGKLAPKAAWAACKTSAKEWLQFDGQTEAIRSLLGKPLLAFCGIGNPKGFAHSLEALGLDVRHRFDFPDHHGYSAEDIAQLNSTAEEIGAQAIVCTHKDLVKIGANRIGKFPVYALLVDIVFEEGEEEFGQLILDAANVSDSE